MGGTERGLEWSDQASLRCHLPMKPLAVESFQGVICGGVSNLKCLVWFFCS